jgi:hypothetical protein
MARRITPIMLPEVQHGEGPELKKAETVPTCRQVCPQVGKLWWTAREGRTMPTTNLGLPPSTGRKGQQANYQQGGKCCAHLRALLTLPTTIHILQLGTTRGVRRHAGVCRVDLLWAGATSESQSGGRFLVGMFSTEERFC